MSGLTLGAIFFIIWWTALFISLPFGLRTQEEAGEVAPGTVASASVSVLGPWRKFTAPPKATLGVHGPLAPEAGAEADVAAAGATCVGDGGTVGGTVGGTRVGTSS